MMAESTQIKFPDRGRTSDDIMDEMRRMRERDVDWQGGRVFSLVFPAGDESMALLKDAYLLFFSENALNPTAFPSLRRMETEVVAMTADLLGGDGDVAGNMTTGGTESIIMAVLTAREWARDTLPSIAQPEILLPETAHPAFFKAAHYFNLKPVVYGIGPDLRADVAAARAAISDSTILLVGSAPAYPHGVVDPIADLARLARERGILLHVDSCVGGFMLPFVRRLGYFVPAFDFGVPGVTSISADLHKYGYAAKGASVILYRTAALRRYQLYAHVDWPGGIYASPTMTGTRPGGAIAAAWAMLNHLGREGYEAVAARVMASVTGIRAGIEAIDGIHVLGDPPMSILALASDSLDVYEIADELSLRGWHLDRQQRPPTLHMTVNHAHVGKEKMFLDALREAVTAVRRPDPRRAARRVVVSAARVATRALPAGLISKLTSQASGLVGADGLPQRSAPMYGMMGTLPNRGDLHELVLDLLEQFTTPQEATD